MASRWNTEKYKLSRNKCWRMYQFVLCFTAAPNQTKRRATHFSMYGSRQHILSMEAPGINGNGIVYRYNNSDSHEDAQETTILSSHVHGSFIRW